MIVKGRATRFNSAGTAWGAGPRIRMQCDCGEAALMRQFGVPWRCRVLGPVKAGVADAMLTEGSRVLFQGRQFVGRMHWTELAYVHYCSARHAKRYEANAAAVIQLAVADPAFMVPSDEASLLVALDRCLEHGSLSEHDAVVLTLMLRGYRPTAEILALLVSGELALLEFDPSTRSADRAAPQLSLAIGD
jgi:hypothetical protein